MIANGNPLRLQTRQLRLAVQAAIDAYEKTGKMVDAALAYAAHGFPIFPLTADKKPIPARDRDANGKPVPNTGSFKKSTTDPIIIQKWWRNNPKALIGLPMGAASGVLCLDVDTIEDHADGLGAWNELAAQHPPIITREHRSATGGPHLIFIWDPEHPIRCGKGALPIGIEVKGQGGYIVVPPSRRKGRSYNVHRDIDPVTPPAWLTDRIWQGRSASSESTYTSDPVAADLDELADALSFIPNDDVSRDEWSDMGLRIFAATGGHARGLEAYASWSEKSSKCHGGYVKRWQGMQSSPPDRTGAEKIFKIAREHGWVRTAAPTYTTATSDIERARDKMKQIIRILLEGPPANPFLDFGLASKGLPPLPPAWAVWVDTGIGKTMITIEELAEWLRKEGAGKLVIYAVPRHRLGREIEKQFTTYGIDARVFRGRDRDDPERDGDKMCLNLPAVELAIACHADVTATCCKYKKMKCRFFERCGYQRQMPEDGQPEVWIVASDMLFHTQKALGQPELVIIDESIWRKGGIGIENTGFEWVVAIDGISNTTPGAIDFADPASELASLRHKLAQALRQQTHSGGVERQYLQLLNTEDCTRAISLEWGIRPKIPLQPGMSDAAIQRLANDHTLIDAIAYSRRMIRIWEAVRELLSNYDIDISGRITLEQNNGQRAVRWRGVAAISQQFQTRTLLLDATLPDLQVLEVFHPQIEIVANIKVKMPPSVRIQQILGAPTSSRKLIENSTLKDSERHLKEIRRYIIARHIETGRRSTLVICQEKVEHWLTEKLPSGITVAHFNDISGLDEFKHVRLLILLGRTQPGPDAPETLAGALSGAQPIKVAPDARGFTWYPSITRGIRLADGSGSGIAVDRCDKHPDPFVEALRWLICEGELLQAFGRARGVNRDPEHLLDIDILSNVVLPIVANEVSQWKAPSLLFETAGEGVMLTSPIDMVKLWPSVWPNRSAADRTLAVGVPVLPGFEQVSYQPAGAKLNSRLAWFDRNLIPDPHGWLERHLGPLKSFR